MTTVDSPALDSAHAAGIRERLAPVWAALEPLATELAFEPGAIILREGTDTPFLGIVATGRAGLRLRVPERGEPLTIVTVEPGELLGWSAVVPPFRATVDAVAMEPTHLVALDAAALRERLAADATLAAALLPIVLESLSSRLAGSWSQLLDLFSTGGAEPW